MKNSKRLFVFCLLLSCKQFRGSRKSQSSDRKMKTKEEEEEKNCLIIRRIILLCKLQINIYNIVHWAEAKTERQKKRWTRKRMSERVRAVLIWMEMTPKVKLSSNSMTQNEIQKRTRTSESTKYISLHWHIITTNWYALYNGIFYGTHILADAVMRFSVIQNRFSTILIRI